MKKFVTDWADVPIIIDLPYAALILGKTYESLKKYAQKGEFPATKVGEEWRVEKEQLQLYLAKNRVRDMTPDTSV